MQLRTFLAKDMKEALCAMRAELGEEAIIVASEKMKDGTMLLRAGIEGMQNAAATSEEEIRRPSTDAALAVDALGSFDARYREALVMRLRVPRTDVPSHPRPFDREQLLCVLRAHRTPDALCEALADAAEASGIPDLTLALAAALDRFMQGGPAAASDPGGMILVGPRGRARPPSLPSWPPNTASPECPWCSRQPIRKRPARWRGWKTLPPVWTCLW